MGSGDTEGGGGSRLKNKRNYADMALKPSGATVISAIYQVEAKNFSSAGRNLVDRDRSLSPETMARLRETEADTVPEPLRKYLVEHDPSWAVEQWFHSDDDVRHRHLSAIIMDDTEQSLGELVACYALESDLPFIIAAILIQDLMEVEGLCTFTYDVASSCYFKKKWTPGPARTPPPMSFGKIRNATNRDEDAYPGNDVYVLEVLADCGYNRTVTARALHTTVPTLRNWLTKIGYLTESGEVREDFDEWYAALRKKQASEDFSAPGMRKSESPPVKASVRDRTTTDEPVSVEKRRGDALFRAKKLPEELLPGDDIPGGKQEDIYYIEDEDPLLP